MGDIKMVEDMLAIKSLSFITCQAADRDQFIEALPKFKPNVILANHSAGDLNALEALMICKKISVSAPFILFTESVSEKFAVEVMKNGACDYLLKKDITQLPITILNALDYWELQSKKRTTEKTIQKQNLILDRANRELDQLVYRLSHNLRSPLMSLQGLVEMSREEIKNVSNSRLFEYFQMIDNSIAKMDGILKEVVDYSKNGRLELTIERLNIKQLIQDCVASVHSSNNFQELKTKITVDGNDTIYTDRYRLNIIFVHLFTNIINQNGLKRNRNLEIIVTTYPKKTEIMIKGSRFDMNGVHFAKVPDTSSSRLVGSINDGLGLQIVRQAVEKLAGEIEIDSEPSSGILIGIEIPYGYQPQKKAVTA